MGVSEENVGVVGSIPTCKTCGSDRVTKAATVIWNPAAGRWDLKSVSDDAHCYACDGSTQLAWKEDDRLVASLIRELNDRFRTEGRGNGSMMITCGVEERGLMFVHQTVQAVRTFDDFNAANDPWHTHDFGAIEVDGESVFFKFDYYDRTLTAGSPNPADETVTNRVLTIMLASEY